MFNCLKNLLCGAFTIGLALTGSLAASALDGEIATGDAKTAPAEQSTPAGAATADDDVLEPKVETTKSSAKEASGQSKATAEARVSVPLTGSKTTLRFELENLSSQTWMAYAPFSNGTVLSVMNPQGQIRLYGHWKPETEPFAMEPGSKKHWDVDIAEYCRFPDKGLYTIWFETGKTPSSGGTVALNSWYEGGKTESNRIQFVKE